MKQLPIILFLILLSVAVGAQDRKFTFASRAHVNFSQVDGDNLVGFSKIGYDIGIEGGYFVSPSSRIVLAQSISNYGSASQNLEIAVGDYVVLVDILSANLMIGYAHHFNIGWETSKSFVLQGGLKYNFVIKNDTELKFNSFSSDLPLDISQIKKRFSMLHLGAAKYLNDNLKLEVHFDYGLEYILDQRSTEVKKFLPYLVSTGLSYNF